MDLSNPDARSERDLPDARSARHLPDADVARDLTVAVVHYQTPDVLVECLERVLGAASGARVLVVDTGDAVPLPRDWPGTHQALARADVEVVAVANRSYAHAANIALALTRTPFLALMNADVYVRPETFANLVYALRDSEVAAVGPVVRDGEGRLQDQGLPYRRFQRRALRGAFAVEVPWLSGCLQVVRMEAVRGSVIGVTEDPAVRTRPRGGAPESAAPRSTRAGTGETSGHVHAGPSETQPTLGPARPLPVGGMDGTLRFYNEDMEWGWRMRTAGWTCQLVATPALHLGGSATPDRDAFLVEGLRGGYVLSQRYRSAAYRGLHRYAVMLWAAVMERLAGPERTTAYRAVRTMFAKRRFDESPFGLTLADENANFWNEMT